MDKALQERYLSLRKQLIEKQFQRMNPEQLDAVVHTDGPMLILAGAGSGKTTVLINRILYMIAYGNAYLSEQVPDFVCAQDLQFLEDCLQDRQEDPQRLQELLADRPVKPWNILAITFTNKAANELKDRLAVALGEQAREVGAWTFHSCCVRILRRYADRLGYDKGFAIYDAQDTLHVVKDAMKKLRVDEKTFPPKSVLGQISSAKDKLWDPKALLERYASDYRMGQIAKIYEEYQKRLKANNAMDFDDLIVQTVRLLREQPDVLDYYQRRFRYIMVDEYQDTNCAQYELVSLLAEAHHNICVVGDDDQSIYRFRGATIENILSFEDQFPNTRVIRLEQNYRSTQTILDAANNIIQNNTQRKGKTLWTQNGAGDPIVVVTCHGDEREAKFVADQINENVSHGAKYSDHAVLYRLNAQSRALESAMIRSGIPYRIVGGHKFFDRKEIKDVISYLHVLNNPSDTLRLLRIINEPKRGIGDATVATAQEISDMLDIPLFEVFRTADSYPRLGRKANALVSFAEMMQDLMDDVDVLPMDELLDRLLELTGYTKYLELQGVEGQSRMENIEELKTSMVHYEQENEDATLSGYLEEIALYTELDSLNDSEDYVVLMTIHSAKGLEFPYVFLVGCEEGIFPGIQAITDPGQLQEERRLCYVAVTRAKKQLYLTRSYERMLFGRTMRNHPSRFLQEIPEKLCDIYPKRSPHSMQNAARPRPDAHAAQVLSSAKTIGVSNATKLEPKVNLTVGCRVRHKVFGEGTVLSVTPMANDQMVEIAFDRVGTKRIMSNFAKLQVLG